jgi:hypothetical protein
MLPEARGGLVLVLFPGQSIRFGDDRYCSSRESSLRQAYVDYQASAIDVSSDLCGGYVVSAEGQVRSERSRYRHEDKADRLGPRSQRRQT